MARQKGIITIEGTLGNMTFFKSQDGYLVREKGGVSADRIANDPAFERTRENNAEFGRAGKASKILRTAFRPILLRASDNKMISRLIKGMMGVIHEDTTNPRGQRNVIDGEASLLEGFEFNDQGKLNTTLFAPYTTTLNRVTGNIGLHLVSFSPSGMIAAPAGTTHWKLTLSGGDVDFEAGSYNALSNESGYIAWDNTPTAALDLSVNIPVNSVHPIFLLVSLEFVQDVNGIKYPLKNGAFNACAIVKVDTP